MSSPLDYKALVMALGAIPIGSKEKRIEAGAVNERERLTPVSWKLLVDLICDQPSLREIRENQLHVLLSVLEVLGVVEIARQEEWYVRSTSVAASYLIQNIRQYWEYKTEGSFIKPDSDVGPFRVVIETGLKNDIINPHLILSNIMAWESLKAGLPPLRQHRVISVLIKGERRVQNSNRREEVYLHVYKPEWGSYALIGSGQQSGHTDIQTAKLAFMEDLATDIDAVRFRASEVSDATRREPTVTRGVYTQYSFNLLVVEHTEKPLLLRPDRSFAWFTIDEIANGKGKNSEVIITNKDLLRAVDAKVGLKSLPTIVPAEIVAQLESPGVQIADLKTGVLKLLKDTMRYFVQQLRWIKLIVALTVVVALLMLVSNYFPQFGQVAIVLGLIAALIEIAWFIRGRH